MTISETYRQLNLKFALADLTYSERDAVVQLIERLLKANRALRAENRRLLAERNALLKEKRHDHAA